MDRLTEYGSADQRVAAGIVARAWARRTSRRLQQQLLSLGVSFIDGCFSPDFLDSLRDLMAELPSSSASKNMYAVRHFVRDELLAASIFERLPKDLCERHGLAGCCSDLRFIRYPLGGYIGKAPVLMNHTHRVTSYCVSHRIPTLLRFSIDSTAHGWCTDGRGHVLANQVLILALPVNGA